MLPDLADIIAILFHQIVHPSTYFHLLRSLLSNNNLIGGYRSLLSNILPKGVKLEISIFKRFTNSSFYSTVTCALTLEPEPNLTAVVSR